MVEVPDQALARAALTKARLFRAEHLVSLSSGILSMSDIIAIAATKNGVALRRITLRQLVLAQQRVGETRATTFLSVLGARMGCTGDLGTKTVAWLIDPRSGGRRLRMWLDATAPRTEPWPGFPVAPRPVAVKGAGV